TQDFIQALDAWMSHGAAVSVPPPGEQQRASQVLIPHDARGALAGLGSTGLAGGATNAGVAARTTAGAGGAGTGGSWATSQPDEPVPVKKSSGGVVIAAALAVLVLGG